MAKTQFVNYGTRKLHKRKRSPDYIGGSTRHRRTKKEIEHDVATDSLPERGVKMLVYMNTDVDDMVAAHKAKTIWDM